MADSEGDQVIVLPKPSDASSYEAKVEQKRTEPVGLKLPNFARKKKGADDGDQGPSSQEVADFRIPNFTRRKRSSAPTIQPLQIECLELDYKTTKELMRSVSGLGMEDPVFGLSNHTLSKYAQRKMPFVNFFDDMLITDIPEDMQDELSICSDPTASFHQRLPALDTTSSKRRYIKLAKEVKAAKKKQTETTISKRISRPNATRKRHSLTHSSYVPPPSVMEFENSRKEEAMPAIDLQRTSMAAMNMSLLQSENMQTQTIQTPEKPNPTIESNKSKPRPTGKSSGKEKPGTSSKTRKPHHKHRHNNSTDFSSASQRLHRSSYISEDEGDELTAEDFFSERKSRSKFDTDVSSLYASDSRLIVNAAAKHGRRKNEQDKWQTPKSMQGNRSKSPSGRKGSRSKRRNDQSDNFLTDSKYFVIERPHESLRSDNFLVGDNNHGDDDDDDDEMRLENLVKTDKQQRNKYPNRASKLYASEGILHSSATPRNRPYQHDPEVPLSQIIPKKNVCNSEVICDQSKDSKMSGITLETSIMPRKSAHASREKRAQVAEALKQCTQEEFERSLTVMELVGHASSEFDCSIDTSDGSGSSPTASSPQYDKAKRRSKSLSGRQERKDGTRKKRPSHDSKIRKEEKDHSTRQHRSRPRSASRDHSKRGRRTPSRTASPTELLQYQLDQNQGGEGEPKVDKSRPRCHSLDSRSEHARKHAAAKRRPRKASKTRSSESSGAAKRNPGKSSATKDSSKKTMESDNMSLATSISTVERAKDIRSSLKRHKEKTKVPAEA